MAEFLPGRACARLRIFLAGEARVELAADILIHLLEFLYGDVRLREDVGVRVEGEVVGGHAWKLSHTEMGGIRERRSYGDESGMECVGMRLCNGAPATNMAAV